MEKQTYDKPLFKVHLIPLANGGPGCNVKALAGENYMCPITAPDGDGMLFTTSTMGCNTFTMVGQTKEDLMLTYDLCYHVPINANTIFWS